MKDYYKLTNAQENILEVEQSLLTYDNTCNILTVSIKFYSDLNYDKLERTLNKLIELNDSFRIRLTKNNNNIKQYIEEYTYQEIELINLKDEEKLEEYIDNYKRISIDIFKELFEFKILKCNGITLVLYKVHHIINDAWGSTQVAEQIKEIYPIVDSSEEIKKLKKIQYLSLIKKANDYKSSTKYLSDYNFWKEYVKNLSTERIFNKDIADNDAKRKIFTLNDEIDIRIKEFCSNNRITEYTFFIAVISIYLNKIFNIKNINIGTPFLNRNKSELDCIGLFVTNLPLYVKVETNKNFLDLCKDINSNNFKIFKHSKFPYSEIQKEFAKINQNTNIFELGFSYQINTLQNNLNGDFGTTKWYFSEKQNNPLTIHLSNIKSKKEIYYDYNTTLFTNIEIESMHSIIIHIIKQVVEQNNVIIKNINILTDEEKKKLIKFNDTGKVDKRNITISEIIDDICKKFSKNIAIKCNNEEINYCEFHKKVCSIAKLLRDNGIKRNTPVAIVFDKSIEMIIAMFAVIKSGGYYIPILPDENKERKEYILNDCKPMCILTKDYANDFNENYNVLTINNDSFSQNVNSIENINSSDDIIYTIYTSGSTGNPKGTNLMHKNVCGLLNSINNDINLKVSQDDVSMSLLKYSFDASGIDIYSSVLNGGKLVLISKEDELNPKKVVEIMQQEKVTRSFLVPKWLELINNIDRDKKNDLSSLRILGTGRRNI